MGTSSASPTQRRLPSMVHHATDPGEGGNISNSKSEKIRVMVDNERERCKRREEQWLLAAKEAAEREEDRARNRWMYGRSNISKIELHSRSNVWLAFLQIKAARILQSQEYESGVGFVIVINAVAIGVEQSLRMDGKDTSIFEMFESVFLCVYSLEMLARLLAYGWRCFEDHWVKLDMALLLAGLTSVAIITPLCGQAHEMASLLVMRMLRLLRLARTLKFLMRFKSLWMLVRGLLGSAGTMGPTLFLLVVILYVFSILGFELLRNHRLAAGVDAEDEFRAIVELHFGTLAQTSMTLIQFISMDSVAAIYKPLVQGDWMLAIYFHALIFVVFVVLMNLVTAVICNNAFEQASQDREAQQIYEQRRREKLVGELTASFHRFDIDGDGRISRNELMEASGVDLQSLYQSLKLDNPEEIFSALDVDGTGEISIDEFCEGVLQAVNSERSVELKRMDKQISSMKKQLNEMERTLASHGELLARAIENHPGAERATSMPPFLHATSPPWALALIQEVAELRDVVRGRRDASSAGLALDETSASTSSPELPPESEVLVPQQSALPTLLSTASVKGSICSSDPLLSQIAGQ
eukprot:TRINITY_DN8647_c0_g1_i1.p1 TRINITY_DN8647_c0_g1~~TRINITY_DN8647_c0_g1_i1.p1  ORF type:complete len:584 (+),score=109.02 TRINITY_DN8647_c0_g1_i1:335-2086(+)